MAFAKPRKLDAAGLEQYAMKLLSARALTVADFKAKLRLRAAQAGDVEPLVAKLKEYGALDDERFAEHFSATRATSGSVGRQRVLSDLLKRRVAPKVAEKAVKSAYDDIDEQALIAQWLDRKYRGQKLGELLKEPAKLASVYRRLRTAGFSSAASIGVLKRYASEADELESLETPGD